eukprot:5491685-Prymnesium_polylepis.1
MADAMLPLAAWGGAPRGHAHARTGGGASRRPSRHEGASRFLILFFGENAGVSSGWRRPV